VVGELAATGERVVALGEDRQEDLEGGEPPRQSHPHVPVVGEVPVDLGIEGEHRSHLHRLVPRRTHHKGSATLAVEGEHAVVHAPGSQHHAIHVDHLAVGQPQLAMIEVRLKPLQ